MSSQEYRNNLANELKQVRNLPLGGKEKDLAEVLLDKSKNMPEYENARQKIIDQRNQRMSLEQEESSIQDSEVNEEEKREKLSVIPLLYDITFDQAGYYVDEIKDSNGKIIFKSPVGGTYALKNIRRDDLNSWRTKEVINKGLFIIQELKGNTYVKETFINANTGTILSFNDVYGVYIHGHTVYHGINTQEGELYNVEGKLLGMAAWRIHDFNEHSFDVINAENDMYKVVEYSTGTVLEPAFSKLLSKVETKEEKILTVETEEGIKEIHVKK